MGEYLKRTAGLVAASVPLDWLPLARRLEIVGCGKDRHRPCAPKSGNRLGGDKNRLNCIDDRFTKNEKDEGVP